MMPGTCDIFAFAPLTSACIALTKAVFILLPMLFTVLSAELNPDLKADTSELRKDFAADTIPVTMAIKPDFIIPPTVWMTPTMPWK